MRLIGKALTFDDVLLIPDHSKVLPADVSLATKLSRNINLNIPLVSAAMDTVTEAKLAIAIAQEGGIGIIHKNLSIAAQAKEVLKVKQHESGVILNPFTIEARHTIADVKNIQKTKKISALPVMDNGKLIGIVTSRDIRFARNLNQVVTKVMTPKDKLVTTAEGTKKEKIIELLHKNRIERVLLVDKKFNLQGMVTAKDIMKEKDYPLACKDKAASLRVGAAVGTGVDTEERVSTLVDNGVDVIIVDTAHGHSEGVLKTIRWAKANYDVDIIGGNIATADAALALKDAGADGVKVGIGPGSICTTRMVAGIGVPQITAVSDVATALKSSGIPVIADGGVRYSGDIAKAIAAGAHSIMVGSMLAGTEEAPGEVELFQGRSYKSYRGMGSLGAMSKGSSDRYFQSNVAEDKFVPEGIEGRVPYKGLASVIVNQMMGGLRSSMGYTGCKDINAMRTKPKFIEITNAGIAESHVHDVSITKEAPNYRV